MMWESHASLTAYSRSAMRCCPKLRSSSILGSYSRVTHERSERSEDRDGGTLYWWYRKSWEWKQSCWFTGQSASLPSPTVLIGLDSDWKNAISEWAFPGGRLRYGEKFSPRREAQSTATSPHIKKEPASDSVIWLFSSVNETIIENQHFVFTWNIFVKYLKWNMCIPDLCEYRECLNIFSYYFNCVVVVVALHYALIMHVHGCNTHSKFINLHWPVSLCVHCVYLEFL